MASRYPTSVRSLAIALYQANATRSEIREAIGCSKDIVRQWCRAAGIPIKTNGGGRKRDPAAIRKAMADYHATTGIALAVTEEPKREYICHDGCTCLLCQLSMYDCPRSSARFIPRPEIG